MSRPGHPFTVKNKPTMAGNDECFIDENDMEPHSNKKHTFKSGNKKGLNHNQREAD